MRRIDRPSVFIHDDGHAAKVKTVLLGCDALAEAIGDVVRTEQGGEDDENLRRNE